MFSNLKLVYALVQPRDRKQVLGIILLMVLTAILQAVGVASILPFLSVLADPSKIQSNPWLSLAYGTLKFESTGAFLYFLGVASFLVFMIGTAMQAATSWVITLFGNMQQFHLSRRLMMEYMRRPYTFFLGRNSGDLSKTVLTETTQAVGGGLLPAMRLVSHCMMATAMVALLLVVEPGLALALATVLGSAYGALFFVARHWLSRIGKDRVAANRERFMAVAEAFGGAKEIRLLGRERDYLDRYQGPARRFARHQANASLFQSLPEQAIEAIVFGGALMLVLFMMSSEGGIATALPLIGLYGLAGKQLIPAFQKIFGAFASIRFNIPAIENVLEDLAGVDPVMRLPLVPVDRSVTPMAPSRSISFVDLRFCYPNSEHPVLDHFNIVIPARSTVGLVGSSGAGKSTLIDVLLGLLEPVAGQVQIDGVALSRSNTRNWQAALGYVPQHIFLADQSVAANIALGLAPNAIDRQAVERAAKMANLHEFIVTELEQGYDTVVGERGARLSGGQRQRIGIARALYRDPAVLVFDEATSALDNATEQAVMEAVHNLTGKKTIILVAHRLTTVRPCNQIFVLDRGRVVEQGTWEDLMRDGSHFAKLAANLPSAEAVVFSKAV